MIIVYFAFAFLCGSLMFSYWLGKLAGVDLKTVGDGNPGAFNLWLSRGYKLGLPAIVLDFAKGYLPLFFILPLLDGPAIAVTAIAPILGHAFSPFMKFNGGKAITVTFGVWSVVTNFRASVVYAVILALIEIFIKIASKRMEIPGEIDGLTVVIGMLLLGLYLNFRVYPSYIFFLWIMNSIILAYTNRFKIGKIVKGVTLKIRHP